jgi:adenylate kinase
MDKSQTFIFVGRSGSGKGTQLELLKKYLSSNYQNTTIKSIVMGDIFRAFFNKEGFFPDLARDVSMKQGKFQPDFITNALFVGQAINVVDSNSFLFLDGYPRNINQMDVTKELLKYVKRENPIILNIEVSRENVKGRMLSRGRGDDSESAIESRLDEYDKFILPMLNLIKDDEYFKYFDINGGGKIEEIHEDIINKITPYL